ncbi:MAG: bifunctional phosphoribosyl-AMP cyclohydrolase/phosphoribosyl-ATP diphosphatase HisIE [Bacteroidales bacterium]
MISIDFDYNKVFQTDKMLVPAVIQDNSSMIVLMVGYMNRESFLKTVQTGLVTFYSRSRQKLWTKGETSGNRLELVSIAEDCDSDTLLVKVNPTGPVCHTGSYSCFKENESEGFLGKLDKIIQERRLNMPDGSYTTKLFQGGTEKICKKIGEECAETIIEAVRDNKERLVYESGDLLFHLFVLLRYKGISLDQIEKELYSRHK